MKIILTGCTGYIGAEVLRQCLQNKSISSIVVLSRRSLQDAKVKGVDFADPKLNVVILEDFNKYPESVMSQLQGAGACIWNLGVKPGKGATVEAARTVRYGYTVAAIEAWRDTIKPAEGGPFRFVYMSGGASVQDQDAKPWVMGEFRKILGQLENWFIKERTPSFEIYSTRPMGVLETGGLPGLFTSLVPFFTVNVQDLAAATIGYAFNGRGNDVTIDNAALRKEGHEYLLKQSQAQTSSKQG